AVLHGGHFRLRAGREHRADRAFDALDLDGVAGGDPAAPMEIDPLQPGAGEPGHHGEHHGESAHETFRKRMVPFTVERSRLRPPAPTVPWKLRGPNRPLTRSGKSETTSPFSVLACTSALKLAGRSRVMPPLTVVNSSPSVQSALPSDATIEPLTVVA